MKTRRLLLILMVLILSLPMAEALAGQTRYITSPNGGKVNLRHGPGETGYAVAVQLEPGTEVTLISSKKGWSKVIYNGYTLYVKSAYLSSSKPVPGGSSSAAASKPSGKIRYIRSGNGKKVNVRTGPGESGYAVAAQLEPGTEVTLISSKNGWSKIVYNGFTVYVKSQYLSGSKSGSGGSSKFSAFDGKVYARSGKTVNLRTDADVKSGVIARLPIWTMVRVIGQKGSWYKIEYGSGSGYIMKKYIR